MADAAAQRFLYAGPIPSCPLLNALLGLPAAEAQVVQQAGYMAAVKMHPEGLVDEAGDTAGRPQLRITAIGDPRRA